MSNRIEVELRDHEVAIGPCQRVDRQFMTNLMDSLFQIGEDYGLEDCYLSFNSTLEPYETSPGDVVVTVFGYRNKTEDEIQEDREESLLIELADSMGISYGDAKVVNRLKNAGKL